MIDYGERFIYILFFLLYLFLNNRLQFSNEIFLICNLSSLHTDEPFVLHCSAPILQNSVINCVNNSMHSIKYKYIFSIENQDISRTWGRNILYYLNIHEKK